MDLKNEIKKSFSEIIDILDKGSDHIDEDVLIKIVDIFEDKKVDLGNVRHYYELSRGKNG